MSAEKAGPPDGQAALARARSLAALGRWQQAIDTLGPALASPVTAADAHCLRAQCLFGLKRPAEAGAAARAALARQPGSAWAHQLLAMSYLIGGRRRAARAEALAAARLQPRSVQGQFVLAMAYLALRQRAKARQAADAAIAADPHKPLAHLAVAKVAESRRDWDTAERAYRAGLGLDPQDAELALGLARLLHRRGRRAEAADAYLAAGRASPADARPRRGLAKLGLPLVAGAGLLAKLAALASVRTVLHAAAGYPDRAALAAGVILAAGCGTTLALRAWGTRNLPEQVREQLGSDHRNAALRWLLASAAVAVPLAAWAALTPAGHGGGLIEAGALTGYAVVACLAARHYWAGPRYGAREFMRVARTLAPVRIHRPSTGPQGTAPCGPVSEQARRAGCRAAGAGGDSVAARRSGWA